MSRGFVARRAHFVEVKSTNDEAMRLMADRPDEPLPLLVTADRQTAGRGRAGRSWWSGPGSLTFTVGLDPSAHALREDHHPRLALAAAVAVVDAIGEYGPASPVGIRWPNDVEADAGKIGGLLPERVETPAGPRIALGIGLNVTTGTADYAEPVRNMATSVIAVVGRHADAPELLARILERLGPNLAALAADDPTLVDRWRQLDRLRGRAIRIDVGDRLIAGIARGIDPAGSLQVELATGEIRSFHGGRVLRDPQ